MNCSTIESREWKTESNTKKLRTESLAKTDKKRNYFEQSRKAQPKVSLGGAWL